MAVDPAVGPRHQDVCRGPESCRCCNTCGSFRWSYDGTTCLSSTCSPLDLRPTGLRGSTKKVKPKAEPLPDWLLKKPRADNLRGRREAASWALARGVELPWDGWRDWLGGDT